MKHKSFRGHFRFSISALASLVTTPLFTCTHTLREYQKKSCTVVLPTYEEVEWQLTPIFSPPGFGVCPRLPVLCVSHQRVALRAKSHPKSLEGAELTGPQEQSRNGDPDGPRSLWKDQFPCLMRLRAPPCGWPTSPCRFSRPADQIHFLLTVNLGSSGPDRR